MLQRMMAEIIFGNPADMHPAIAGLVGRDFTGRFLDEWFDDEGLGPHVWILAFTESELDQSAFFGSVKAIIEPLGGDVIEVGLAPADVEARIASKT